MSACELCPRRCGADRLGGGTAKGWCSAPGALRLFRWGPHFGEEPPLSGERGSGCIFFSHCTMKCIYCQNSPWSWRGEGREMTVAELAGIMRDLAVKDKVENFNLVSPTPYLPFIREAVSNLSAEGIKLPMVWNSSGYERIETLEEYSELCDWALFDLRYSNDKTAILASSAPDYVATARKAVKWAWEKRGGGKSKDSGVIVRILVLPDHADEAIENLSYLAKEVSNEIPVSIMSQYTPAYLAKATPPFDRGVTESEYEAVVEAASDLGFENGWTQGFGAADPSIALLGENMPADHGSVM